MSCERCNNGKISYGIPGDLEPTRLPDGTTVQSLGGLGTRACPCVRDLPPVDDGATWWEVETTYRGVALVPIGNDCIEITAICEVPRRADGRRVHRTPRNAFYPPLVDIEFPSKEVTMHASDVHALITHLAAAAAACEASDAQTAAFAAVPLPCDGHLAQLCSPSSSPW